LRCSRSRSARISGKTVPTSHIQGESRTGLPPFLKGGSLLSNPFQGLLECLTPLSAERIRLVSEARKLDLHRHDRTIKLLERIRL